MKRPRFTIQPPGIHLVPGSWSGRLAVGDGRLGLRSLWCDARPAPGLRAPGHPPCRRSAGLLDGVCSLRRKLPVLSLVPAIESRLPTTRALAYLDSQVSDRVVSFTIAYSASGPGGSTGNPVQSVAFAPTGNVLTTSQAGTVRFWNSTTGRLLGATGGTHEDFLRIGHSEAIRKATPLSLVDT
jgi:WD40 repeat protein